MEGSKSATATTLVHLQCPQCCQIVLHHCAGAGAAEKHEKHSAAPALAPAAAAPASEDDVEWEMDPAMAERFLKTELKRAARKRAREKKDEDDDDE